MERVIMHPTLPCKQEHGGPALGGERRRGGGPEKCGRRSFDQVTDQPKAGAVPQRISGELHSRQPADWF